MSNDPNPGQARELNLQKTAEQFMVGLQRHFDMLAFNLASRGSVTETAYNERVRATNVMPFAPAHQNFEQMQAYSRDLLFCQSINDALNMALAAMNQMHLFLAVIKINKEQSGISSEGQRLIQETQRRFEQSQADQKFNRLEEDYGVMCELEDSVVSLGFCLQALVQQGGIVREPQLDEDGQLVLELKVAGDGPSFTTPGSPVPANLETERKILREGEKVAFTDRELQSVIVTVAIFAHQLFAAVARYAQENRPGA